MGNGSGNGCSGAVYTGPSGKALVITAVSGLIGNMNGPGGCAGFFLDKNASCAPPDITASFTPATGDSPIGISLGAGAVVPSGTSLYTYNSASFVFGYIHGYLVPATAIPAAGTAEAAELSGPPLPKGFDKANMLRPSGTPR